MRPEASEFGSQAGRKRSPSDARRGVARKSSLRRVALEALEPRTLLSNLPAPQVTGPPIDISNAGGNESAPSIAIDPNNSQIEAAAWTRIDPNLGTVSVRVQAAVSVNGGATWSSPFFVGGVLPNPTTSNPVAPFPQVTDAHVAFDRSDNLYILDSQHVADNSTGALVVSKFSLAGGVLNQTFVNHVVYQWVGQNQAYTPTLAVDSNLATFSDVDVNKVTQTQNDPNSGDVYVAWATNETAPKNTNNFNPNQIFLVSSSDGANSFSSPQPIDSFGSFGPQRDSSPQIAISQGAAPRAAGTNGPSDPGSPGVQPGQVTVIWDDFGSGANGNPPVDFIRSNTITGSDTTQTFSSAGGPIIDAGKGTGPGGADGPTPTDFQIPVTITDPNFTTLSDLSVKVNLIHPNDNELSLVLIPPPSSLLPSITLVQNQTNAAGNGTGGGVSGANFGTTTSGVQVGTTFDDNAILKITDGNASAPFDGVFRPEVGSLRAAYRGATAAQLKGSWTLEITDFRNGNVGSLTNWSIQFTSGTSTAANFNQTVTETTVRGSLTGATGLDTALNPLGIGPGLSIASDNTLGAYSPYQGRLYVTYVDRSTIQGNPADNTDVFLITSDDGGQTWQTPTFNNFAPGFFGNGELVNNDNATTDGYSESNPGFSGRPQFEPQVAVDQATGSVVLSWYDTRDDASRLRVATYVTASNDGGQSFSPQIYVNQSQTAVDAITGQTVKLGPIPDNESSGNGSTEKTFGFGLSQGLAVYGGVIHAAWSSNLNGGNRTDGQAPLDIRTAAATIPAGPRIISSTMGPVGLPGDTLNNQKTADGTPIVQSFDVTFDRPVDPFTFGTDQVQVFYHDPTSTNVSGEQVPVSLVTPLNSGPFGATTFRVDFAPRSGVGTYSYTVGPDIRDRIRTAVPTVTPAGSSQPFGSTDTPLRVPPTGTAGTTFSTLSVASFPANEVVANATVNLSINHTFDSDMIITLISPDGTRVLLSNREGGGGHNYTNTTFSDAGTTPINQGSVPFTGTFQPEVPLSTLKGHTLDGNWQLEVDDVAFGDFGTLLNWTLTLTPGLVSSTQTSGNTMDQNGNSLAGESATNGVGLGDVYAVPTPTATGAGFVAQTGQFYGGPYNSATLPLIIPGPHVVSTDLPGGTASTPAGTGNLEINGPVSSIDVTFDRDMNPASFMLPQVLGIQGPLGPITPTSITRNPNGTDPDPTHPRTYRINFPQQVYSGTYTVQLASTITSKNGDALDTNLNAGVDVLRDTPSTNATGPVTYPSTNVGLPVAPGATETSTLQVPDNFTIQGLQVALDITEPNDPDLTATLVGPDGTSITLFSGVGGTGTHADFHQTVFDDTATTPIQNGGPPFTGRYAPQQPLSSYVGRASAGTWKLILTSDNPKGVAGALNSWSLTFTQSTVSYPSPNTPANLPVGKTVTSTLTVPDSFTVQNPTLTLDITEPYDPGLTATLTGPDGTTITLFSSTTGVGNSGTKANFTQTTFDDNATTLIQSGSAPFTGRFVPQQPLSAFAGKNAAGVWTLTLTTDATSTDANAQAGVLNNWSLSFQKVVPISGLGEPVADQFSTSFRIFTTSATNPVSSSAWTPVGPTSIGTGSSGALGTTQNLNGYAGRVSSIAVDPSDPSGNTVYAAAASGGVWKTTDFLTTDPAGPTWIPLTDFGPTYSVNIGSIAVFGRNNDPNQSIIFAGTGEGNTLGAAGVNINGNTSQGLGILRSMDGGKTWTLLNRDTQGRVIFGNTSTYKIVVDPHPTATGNVIVYAAMGGASGGLWRSTDTGNSWQRMSPTAMGDATDIVLDPNSATVDQVSNPTGNVNIIYAAFPSSGVYISPNRGQTLNAITGINFNTLIRRIDVAGTPAVPVSGGNQSLSGGRIVLAKPALVSANGTNADVENLLYEGWLYAAVSGADNHFVGLFLTKDYGQTWTKVPLSTVPSPGNNSQATPSNDVTRPAYDPTSGPGWPFSKYNLSLVVDPANPNVAYLGGSSNGNSSGLVRVDTTGVFDSHAFVGYSNSQNDSGTLQFATTGRTVLANNQRGLPYREINPFANNFSIDRTQYLNLLVDPTQPFQVNTTLYAVNAASFTNNGAGIKWTPLDQLLKANASDGVPSTNVHQAVAMVDPITGQTRLIFADDQGVFTGALNPDGTINTGIGSAVSPTYSRNGDLQIAEVVAGASQPSTAAAQLAKAVYYANSTNVGFSASAPGILGNGDVSGNGNVADSVSPFLNTGDRYGAGIATDQQGQGIVYQYANPGYAGLGTNFFQVSIGGLPFVARTSGLIQNGPNDPQWPNSLTDYGDGIRLGQFAVNPVDGSQVIISSAAGRVFSTITQGKSWQVIANPTDLDGTYADALAYGAPDPNGPNGVANLNDFLYAGTVGGNIFVTQTGGGSNNPNNPNAWTNITSSLDGSPVMQIIPDPVRGSHDAFAVTAGGEFNYTFNGAVPGNGLPVGNSVTTSVTIPDYAPLDGLTVNFNIDFPQINGKTGPGSDSDLAAYLIAPDGTKYLLFSGVGGTTQGFTGTSIGDSGTVNIANVNAKPPYTGAFQAQSGVLAGLGGPLNHVSMQGTWQLQVVNITGNATDAVLTNFSLTPSAKGGVYYNPNTTGTYTPGSGALNNNRWIDITGNLFQNQPKLSYLSSVFVDWRYVIPVEPSLPANVDFAPTHPELYVAGEGGVYRSLTDGQSWTAFPNIAFDGAPQDGGLLPNAHVTSLSAALGNIDQTTGRAVAKAGDPNTLLASTYGRGQFEIRLAPTVLPNSNAAGTPNNYLYLDPADDSGLTPAEHHDQITNVTNPHVDGFSEQSAFGNTVYVTLLDLTNPTNPVPIGGYNPNDPTTAIAANRTDGNGLFKLNFYKPLADGTYTVGVQATDQSGTKGNIAKLTFTIDTSAEGPPGAPTLEPGSDTGSSNSDRLTKDNNGAAGPPPLFDVNVNDPSSLATLERAPLAFAAQSPAAVPVNPVITSTINVPYSAVATPYATISGLKLDLSKIVVPPSNKLQITLTGPDGTVVPVPGIGNAVTINGLNGKLAAGTYTLSITNGGIGTGSFPGWSLSLSENVGPSPLPFSATPPSPVTIPAVTATTSTLTIPATALGNGNATIPGLVLDLSKLAVPSNADLSITLTGPDGTTIPVPQPYSGVIELNGLNGKLAAGTYTLSITNLDPTAKNVGALGGWSLALAGANSTGATINAGGGTYSGSVTIPASALPNAAFPPSLQIPGNGGDITSIINVPASSLSSPNATIASLALDLSRLVDTTPGNLTITLTAPDGTVANVPGIGNSVAITGLNGKAAAGNYRLTITNYGTALATLGGWSLALKDSGSSAAKTYAPSAIVDGVVLDLSQLTSSKAINATITLTGPDGTIIPIPLASLGRYVDLSAFTGKLAAGQYKLSITNSGTAPLTLGGWSVALPGTLTAMTPVNFGLAPTSGTPPLPVTGIADTNAGQGTIPDGVYLYSAIQTDLAGNNGPIGPGTVVTIDAHASTLPAPSLTPDTDTGLPVAPRASDDITNNPTPDFQGYAEPGSSVALFVNGAAGGNGLADPVTGYYKITATIPLTGGLNNITVQETDAAGNVGAMSLALVVRLDTTPPPAIQPKLALSSDTGRSNKDGVTFDPTPTFVGVAEKPQYPTQYLSPEYAGALIELFAQLDSAQKPNPNPVQLVGEALADPVTGNYSVTVGHYINPQPAGAILALADGTYNISAIQVDVAGNASKPILFGNTGAVVIDGTDSALHGDNNGPGNTNEQSWLYVQDVVNAIAPNITSSNKTLVYLGAKTDPSGTGLTLDFSQSVFAQSTLPGKGWNAVYLNGAANINAFLSGVPTTVTDAKGNIVSSTFTIDQTGFLFLVTANKLGDDIDNSELAVLDQHGPDIRNFVNTGAGFYAEHEEDFSNAEVPFGWLTSIFPGLTAVQSGGGTNGLIVTPAGQQIFPTLTAADFSSAIWHNYFTGNFANQGLAVAVTVPDPSTGTQVPLVLASNGGIATPTTSQLVIDTDGPDPKPSPAPILEFASDTSGGLNITRDNNSSAQEPAPIFDVLNVEPDAQVQLFRTPVDPKTLKPIGPTVLVNTLINGAATTTVKIADINQPNPALTTPGAPIPDGTYFYTEQQTDLAGIVGAMSAPVRVTILTTPPPPPSTFHLDPNYDTGRFNNDGVTRDNNGIYPAPLFDLAGVQGTNTVELFRDGKLVRKVTNASPTNGQFTIADINNPTANATTPGAVIADGTHTYYAIQLDLAGNVSNQSPTITVTVDSDGPDPKPVAAPVLELASDTSGGLNITRDNNSSAQQPAPIFDVANVEPAAQVQLFRTPVDAQGNAGTPVLVNTIINNGASTVTVKIADINQPNPALTTSGGLISDGVYYYYDVVTDLAGVADTRSGNTKVTIDTTSPVAPTPFRLDAGSDTGRSNSDGITRVTIIHFPVFDVGNVEAGSTIQLYRNGVLVNSQTYATAGNQTIQDNNTIPDGTYTYFAKQIDSSGNVSVQTPTITVTYITVAQPMPGQPVLDPNSDTGIKGDNITSNTAPTLDVSNVQPHDTLELVRDGNVVATITDVGALGGTIQISDPGPVSFGLHTYQALQIDAAGNPSPLGPAVNITFQTDQPGALTLDPSSDSGTQGDNITDVTSNLLIDVSGVTAGATVNLLRNGVIVATLNNAPGGTAKVADPGPLAPGQYTYTAQQVINGDVSPSGPSLTITIDTTTPSAPGQPVLDPLSDSGKAGDNLTNVTTPTIDVPGIVPGATVQLFRNGSLVATQTSAAGGTVAITDNTGVGTLTQPTPFKYTAKQVSAAGNASPSSLSLTVTIDTTVPTTPTISLDPADQTSLGATVTNVPNPTIDVSGVVPNATVNLYRNGVIVNSAPVPSGNTSGKLTLTDPGPVVSGQYTYTVVQDSAAGTSSLISNALGVTVSLGANNGLTTPTLSLSPVADSGIPGDNVTSLRQLTFNGTANPPGVSVSVYNAATNAVVGTTTSDAQGRFSVTAATPLVDGVYSFFAKSADSMGNASQPSTSLTVHVVSVLGDYNGTGVTDPAVARRTNAGLLQWFVQNVQTTSFGAGSLDIPLLGDFDGDGKTDLALYRPSTAQWFIQDSSQPGTTQSFTFGEPNVDIPVVGNFFGNGISGAAVYRPTTGQWYIGGVAQPVSFGGPSDTPVPGHYAPAFTPLAIPANGTLTTTINVPTSVASSTGGVISGLTLDLSSLNFPAANVGDLTITLVGPDGTSVPLPVPYNNSVPVTKLNGKTAPGVYTLTITNAGPQTGTFGGWSAAFNVTGNTSTRTYVSQTAPVTNAPGTDEEAVYRASSSEWFILGPNGGYGVPFGGPNDVPVPGTYDDTATYHYTEEAVFRPSTGQYFILGPNNVPRILQFAPGDIPAPGDYDGVGYTEAAVFRPSTSQWLVWSPNATSPRVFATFGGPTDIPTSSPSSYRSLGLSAQSLNMGATASALSVASSPSSSVSGATPALSSSSTVTSPPQVAAISTTPVLRQRPNQPSRTVHSNKVQHQYSHHVRLHDAALSALGRGLFGRHSTGDGPGA